MSTKSQPGSARVPNQARPSTNEAEVSDDQKALAGSGPETSTSRAVKAAMWIGAAVAIIIAVVFSLWPVAEHIAQ